jgi:hypothetical protein
MAFQIVGTAFANAATITIPAHLAGDVIVIFAWRNDSATPPSVGAGFFTLTSGASGTFSNRTGWRTAADSSTTSGTWTNATRLACVVVRDATIDESSATQAGSSSSDDFYWGPTAAAPFPGPRRALMFGENNATYVGSAAATVPTGYTNLAFVNNQGSVIHLSDSEVTFVDQFVSLTSSGGTPGYRTGTVPLIPLREGTLAATETGSDTFAGTGTVRTVGTLAVSETGSDTFAGTGTVLSATSGSLAAVETGSDLFAGTGGVLVSGTFVVQETGSDIFSGVGGGAVALSTGTMTAVEIGSDILSITGFLSVVDNTPSAPTVSGAATLRQEDTTFLLLEDGGQILLETQALSPTQLTYTNIVYVDARPRIVYATFGNLS